MFPAAEPDIKDIFDVKNYYDGLKENITFENDVSELKRLKELLLGDSNFKEAEKNKLLNLIKTKIKANEKPKK